MPEKHVPRVRVTAEPTRPAHAAQPAQAVIVTTVDPLLQFLPYSSDILTKEAKPSPGDGGREQIAH